MNVIAEHPQAEVAGVFERLEEPIPVSTPELFDRDSETVRLDDERSHHLGDPQASIITIYGQHS